MSVFDFNVKGMDGSEIALSKYKGEVLLVVNTATGCGFTPQYTGLQELYSKYHEKGFEVLDFPCNQFMNQAPGNEEEIHSFCTGRFGITFPQFAKIDVNGAKTDPLFAYLKNEAKGAIGSNIKWNFTKFLVNREGKVLKRFAPTATPESIDEYIATALEA